MLAEAYGELGLHPWEFYRYSWDEFVLKRKGQENREVKEWHKARMIAYYAAAPHMKKGFKISDIIELPGDAPARKKLSKEERELIRQRYKDLGVL